MSMNNALVHTPRMLAILIGSMFRCFFFCFVVLALSPRACGNRSSAAVSAAGPMRRIRRRPPRKSASRARARARRQTAEAARRAACLLRSGHRLELMSVSNCLQTSEGQRLLLAHDRFARMGLPAVVRVALLVLDWAIRSPGLSAAFLAEAAARHRDWSRPEDAMRALRKVEKKQAWQRFWSGKCKFNARCFFDKVKDENVLQFAELFTAGSRVRVPALMQAACKFPHCSSYLAFAMIRIIAAAAGIALRDSLASSIAMSKNTSLLAAILPLSVAEESLKQELGEKIDTGFLAFMYCEMAKVLRAEGVVGKLEEYEVGGASFQNALLGRKLLSLLRRMKRAVPVENKPCKPESEALNLAIPFAKRRKHVVVATVEMWNRIR